ncbi:PspA/IM30 family protein [Escherichia coli]|nr:PspA/IM30 family protein [Escherichia coli]EFH2411610.1 PspA/IM30 family protein [Escherichia coli]
MGILKSLFTLGKSFISQAEESIEETQGVRMLEQHIRDAKAELDKAGKSRVDLLARVKLSHDKLKDLRERKASLEARALEALSKNVNPSLINEVAEEIYSAAIFLIPICISFDTAEKRRYATYLILNRRFSFEF